MVLWFIEESCNQFLPRGVCSRAIALLDWFWMSGARIGIDKLQELGIACLGLAWKIDESGVGMIPVDEHNFSRASIMELEKLVLKQLSYKVSGPSYLSIALELLQFWEKFVEKSPQRTQLPRYVQNIRDDECHDLAAVLRLD